MNLAVYPPRQPFPKNPAVSIRAQLSSDAPDQSTLATYPFPPYDDAERELQSYARLAKADDAGGSDRIGTTIGIKGPPGSGKTHLIYYLMQRARAELPQAYQIYVKAESSDLLDLYSRALQFLGSGPLREIHTVLLSNVAQRELVRQDPGNELKFGGVSQSLARHLIVEPNAVYNLLQNRVLSESSLLSARSGVLEGARSYFDDFLHAYSYLLHETLSDHAFDWICGRKLPFEVLQQLGVRRDIADEEMAFTGFRFLIALFSGIKRQFFVFIDQIERLIYDAEPPVREVNKGRLHTLVELANNAGGLLCLAGTTKAWDEFPGDFLERLSAPPFKMPNITTEQIFNLVTIYLHPGQMNSRYHAETDIYPFNEAAIREISKIARGNIRSILSLCNRSFEEAAKQQELVTPKLVQEAAIQLKQRFDRTDILMQAKMTIKSLGLDCTQEFTIDGNTRVDLVVPDPSDPRLLIDVSEPNFLEDEARAALRYVSMAHAVKTRWPEAKILIVEAGYMSAEVQGRLRPYLDAHIVYNPDEFPSEFAAAVEFLAKGSDPRPESRVETKVIEQQLRQILEARASDQQIITYNIRQALQDDPKMTRNRILDFYSKIGLMLVSLTVIMVVLFGITQWFQYQRNQEGLTQRREALQMTQNLWSDKDFKATLVDFYKTADSLGLKPSADQGTRLKDQLLNDYYNLQGLLLNVVQCAVAKICDPHVVCGSLGQEISSFVRTAQRYELVDSADVLTSFAEDACGISFRHAK
jgi:hypothetical protein